MEDDELPDRQVWNDHADLKSLNRGRLERSHLPGRVECGNSTSTKPSRPSGKVKYRCASRLYVKQEVQAIQNFGLIDSDASTMKTCLKVPANQATATSDVQTKPRTNLQGRPCFIDGKAIATQQKLDWDLKDSARICQLSNIHERLYLASTAGRPNASTKFQLVVNFVDGRGAEVKRLFGSHVHNIVLKDERDSYSYRPWCQLMEAASERMDSVLEQTDVADGMVLIRCPGGVNRSVGLVMYYAMTRLGFTFDDALNAIENDKLSIFRSTWGPVCGAWKWNNLTNIHLRNALRALSSNLHTDSRHLVVLSPTSLDFDQQ